MRKRKWEEKLQINYRGNVEENRSMLTKVLLKMRWFWRWLSCRWFEKPCRPCTITVHYNDVIMSAMASQITGVSIVCAGVCSGVDQRTSKLRVTGLCDEKPPVTGGFPSQRASNAENVSIWWRLHEWQAKASLVKRPEQIILTPISSGDHEGCRKAYMTFRRRVKFRNLGA